MLSILFKLSFRSLFRTNRLYTGINVIGLVAGFTSLILVSLFVYDEYNFDHHYSSSDRIYRIVTDFNSNGNITSWAKTSAPVGKYLQGAYPEVEEVARIRKNPGTDLISVNDEPFYEEGLFFVDSTFFQIFDLPFVHGDAREVLTRKNSIILTERLALKYFGITQVVGKSISYNNQLQLTITGVVRSMPRNSHFIADAFVTFSTLDDLFSKTRLNHWGQFDHYTYVMLKKGVEQQQLEDKLPDLIKRHAPEWVAEKESLHLQPIVDIHLHSELKDEISSNSDEKYSYILGSIALFIVFMAFTNFVNLSTATQLSRTRETGIQKALGANNQTLGIYFLIESGIICVSALFLSLIFAQILLPYFNTSTGKYLQLFSNLVAMGPVIACTLLITLITSAFPTIRAVGLVPFQLSKSKISGKASSGIRNALVTLQFSISIVLIIITWVVFDQLSFLESTQLGFESKQVIVVPIKDRSQNDHFKTITNEIEQLPGVLHASFSSSTPGANNSLTYTYTLPASELGEQPLATFLVDDNFFELYQIKIKEGRLVNPLSTDTLSDVVLNEAAVKLFGIGDPIGAMVTGKVHGRVVGIVENFNHTSLHSDLTPVIMYPFTPTFRFLSVKLDESTSGIESLARKWPELYHGFPLEYSYLTDQIKDLYGSEVKLKNAYISFSLIAVILSLVGLIGLNTFLLNRKLKEISIRKIFGSSARQILSWVISGFIPILLTATVIAGATGYFIAGYWLENFSFRIELVITYFIIPPICMSLLLVITTTLQSMRASLSNPVKYLREN